MRRSACVFVLLLLAVPVVAAPVDGNWSGSINTPQGAVEVAFTFKAEGAVLVGSTTGPDGTVSEILNGTIDGENIAFDVDLDFGGQTMTLAYTGVIAGDQITLTIDFMGMALEVLLTKS